jgi:GNAT superfamily N-acetyltransferase
MPTENSWSDVVPVLDDEPVESWNTFKTVFGEIDLTAIGYSQQPRTIRAAVFNEGKDEINMRFSLFRNDEGVLICVHASYIVDGIQKPYLLLTHPDYQRQGYGTRLAEYVVNQRSEEISDAFPYAQAWGDVTMTSASASFANKFAKSKLF